MINKFREIPPQKIFLVIGIIFGIIFLIVTPPFQVPDEEVHFYKAYTLSEGMLTPEKVGNETGYYVSQSLLYDTQKFRYLRFQPEHKVKTNSIIFSLETPINSNNLVFLDYHNVGVPIPIAYPPIPYIIPALAMGLISFIVNPSVLFLMYIGRLVNLLVWAILIYLAIKITPVHKWVFVLLALMPMTLFQAASLSVDSFTMGICFLTIAFIFKLSFKENNINKKDILILLIFTLLITLSKPGYVIILMALLMIPIVKFRSKAKKLILLMLVPLTAFISNKVWNSLLVLDTTTGGSGRHNSFYSIIADPINFINIVINTINLKFNFYLVTFVGKFGWLDTPLALKTSIAVYLAGIYLGIIILTALIDKNKLNVSLKQKIIAFSTTALLAILIFVSQYTSWTAKGATIIEGVQGRYLLPLTPLIFIILYNNKDKISIKGKKINLSPKNISLLVIPVVLVYLTVSVFTIISRFYLT
jgi:uncharacterized membrane protein